MYLFAMLTEIINANTEMSHTNKHALEWLSFHNILIHKTFCNQCVSNYFEKTRK